MVDKIFLQLEKRQFRRIKLIFNERYCTKKKEKNVVNCH